MTEYLFNLTELNLGILVQYSMHMLAMAS